MLPHARPDRRCCQRGFTSPPSPHATERRLGSSSGARGRRATTAPSLEQGTVEFSSTGRSRIGRSGKSIGLFRRFHPGHEVDLRFSSDPGHDSQARRALRRHAQTFDICAVTVSCSGPGGRIAASRVVLVLGWPSSAAECFAAAADLWRMGAGEETPDHVPSNEPARRSFAMRRGWGVDWPRDGRVLVLPMSLSQRLLATRALAEWFEEIR